MLITSSSGKKCFKCVCVVLNFLKRFKIKHLIPVCRSQNIMNAAEWVGMATVAMATEVGHWLCR